MVMAYKAGLKADIIRVSSRASFATGITGLLWMLNSLLADTFAGKHSVMSAIAIFMASGSFGDGPVTRTLLFIAFSLLPLAFAVLALSFAALARWPRRREFVFCAFGSIAAAVFFAFIHVIATNWFG
jgi:hypothetical protein